MYGMNVSFIDHLDIAFSAGAVLLLLFLIGAFCACRKGLCLKWILGKRFMHMHQPPATPTNQLCTSTAINMPTIASAPNQLPDPMDEEIAALQKRNQLIELQQRRSQLMANANLEQGPMRYSFVRRIFFQANLSLKQIKRSVVISFLTSDN